MNQIKQALKSKTVRFSIALAVLSILQGYVGFFYQYPRWVRQWQAALLLAV